MRGAAALAVLAMMVGSALAQTASPVAATPAAGDATSEPAQATQPADRFRGEYAIMASTLNLSESQRGSLTAILEQHEEAVDQWEQTSGDKATRLGLDLRQARQAKDEPLQQKLIAQIDELKAQRTELQVQKEAKIQVLLSPEQRLTWETFRLRREAMRRYKRAQLSQDQIVRVEQMCSLSASQVVLAPDGSARKQIRDKVFSDMSMQVLTPDQRAVLEAPVQRHHGDRPVAANVDSVPGPDAEAGHTP